MVDLIAKSPANGLRPVTHGDLTLRELEPQTITSIMPFAGQEVSVSAALEETHGVGLPEIGRLIAGKRGDILWTGRGQFFLIGDAPGPLNAAVTDQSDAWTCVALECATTTDVLCRLCPLDFRQMDEGDVARSLIGHMSAILIRRSDGFDLMVYRAVAKTLIHEVEQAMKSVAAQRTRL